ncbi:hypothetical protein GCM10009741_60290 [Kribbella lupini]|uniref:Uncharacterized protein n=1 Tax=Kribbella lupini TaxID=291602 RepID=A0ABN2BX20_9ACTN
MLHPTDPPTSDHLGCRWPLEDSVTPLSRSASSSFGSGSGSGSGEIEANLSTTL